MIISLNWLKKYVTWDIPTEELVELIGARLVEVEEVIDERGRYDNVFVVRVVSAEKIPDTHLTLCQIDAKGEGELTQVVCGAPNVREGMLAVWIAPGATVPASWNEDAPFVIGTRKMRGYESNGMLAGADELGFGDTHKTIAEIDPAVAKAGDRFADVFGLGDILLDIENKSLTHRPDCFGIIGFAREVAGILGKEFVEPEFLVGKAATHIVGQEKIELKIKIEDGELCPRYEALVMSRKSGTKDEYLTELQTLVSRSGMRPIDPIVDMTNYLMLLTGQPLHAFDWDKFVAVGGKKTPEIVVRAAKNREKMTLLDGREIEMDEKDIVITSSGVPVALAGAMGGANTVIDDGTKKIIVESATFSLYNLRKTQMRHGIFSEAITRFTKGQPVGMTDPVVREFAREMAGRLVPLALFDERAEKQEQSVVRITTAEINAVLGTDYSWGQVEKTLRNVGFEVSCDCGKSDKCKCESVNVRAPFWRTDIHATEDVIEEVGRLLGYDNIPTTTPMKHMSKARVDEILTLKQEIRRILAGAGANEVLTYSFVHGDLIGKARQNKDNSYKIVNSLSPALEYTRQSLIPSLLDAATDNHKDGYGKFTLFEMNPVTCKPYGLNDEGVPIEKQKLALVHFDEGSKTPYYALKLQIEVLLGSLGITPVFGPIEIREGGPASVMSPNRSAEILDKASGESLGIIGEISPRVAADFKLPGAAVAQLHLDDILRNTAVVKFGSISSFPSVNRDVTLVVAADTEYARVEGAVGQILEDFGLLSRIAPVSIYQGEDTTKKSISLHLEFASPEKTLTKKEISDIMEQIEKVEIK